MNNLTGYKTSRDYKRLAELAKKQSVICIVDYLDGRDIAQSFAANHEIYISSRGRCYLYAGESNLEEFIEKCQAANVEFIEPEEVK